MPRDPRTYLTYPTGYTGHPRWELHSDAAFRALHEMNDYCRSNNTDGRIDSRIAEKRWSKKVLAEIVDGIDDRPLVVVDGDAYVMRSYADHQMTAADIDDLRAKRAEAGRRGGIAKANAVALAKQNPWQKPLQILPKEKEEKKEDPSSEIADAITRPEIDSLLSLLDAEIEANGGKKPARTKKNIDAMRLMLDRDGHTTEQIERAIRWCQADEFWRSNILSASKLREKYETLRLAAQRVSKTAPPAPVRIDPEQAWRYR